MQKLFVTFLSVLYLVLSSGFTQYAHTCKATAIKTYSLTNSADHPATPCPICTAKEKGLQDKKKNCCKHESKIVKVDDSIKKQSGSGFTVKFWGDAIPNKMLGTVFDFACDSKNVESSAYPPSKIPLQGNPLYILHCVYKI